MTPTDVQALRDEIAALLAEVPDDTGIWMGHSLCLQIRDALLSVRPDAQALEALRDEMAHEVFRGGNHPALGVGTAMVDRWCRQLDALLHGAGRLPAQKDDLLSDMRQHIQHRWVAQPDKIEDWYWAIHEAGHLQGQEKKDDE